MRHRRSIKRRSRYFDPDDTIEEFDDAAADIAILAARVRSTGAVSGFCMDAFASECEAPSHSASRASS